MENLRANGLSHLVPQLERKVASRQLQLIQMDNGSVGQAHVEININSVLQIIRNRH